MELALLLVTFVVTLALGVPVAICLALSSLAYMLVAGLPIVILPQRMYAGMDVFVLLCIPGFILAGNLMNYGGCLLYTSPSPRDQRGSRMPSSA